MMASTGETLRPRVVVGVSTYNGEKYLAPQLDSLLRQDYGNFQIVIRDDGSTDSTLQIIGEYCRHYPGRLILDQTASGNMGVTRSFLSLLAHVDDASCLMFCDQDDVWFEGKISTFVNRLQELERQAQAGCPILVFGDMIVTNEDLQVIANSFWQYQRLDVGVANDWRRVMMSNFVTGCSSLLNPAAVSLLKEAPSVPVLHDHLAAILIARDGILTKLAKPTMFYRQHRVNVEGARHFGIDYLLRRLGYFARVIAPRYKVLCKVFGVPLSVAAYMKMESIYRRLRKSY